MVESPALGLRAYRAWGAEKLLKDLRTSRDLPVKSSLSPLSPMGVRLEGYASVLGEDLFEKGAFEIQDEGSQMMAWFTLWPELFGSVLQGAPGDQASEWKVPPFPKAPPSSWRVIDACAGAGGKALALGDGMQGGGRIFAYDISERKLQALRRRATRAGLRNIQAVALPESEQIALAEKFEGSADRVLIDAPCSGWGVLRRNPDAKWRQGAEQWDRLPPIQQGLLKNFSRLVKPGGVLVYGVCTFRRSETDDVVGAWLETNPGFERLASGYLGPGLTDGFYIAAFRRSPQ
jgi:16S rRNA (cytosine967-C5)-methyltransferase